MKNEIVMVVLAAGSGKRFWPFVTDKNLFPFLGKPMFDYAFPATLPPQVTRCVIVTSPSNRAVFSGMTFPIPHTVVVQEKPMGMADAILSAKQEIQGKSIIIVIADDISDPALMNTMLRQVRPDVAGVLTGWKTETYFPGGYIMFREDRPIGIREKPGAGKTPSDYVYFGGQYIENADKLLEAITSLTSETDDVYEKALSQLMSEFWFTMVPVSQPFVSLKYPWHVLDVMTYLLEHRMKAGRGKNVEIRNNVSIEGSVYLGNNVRIFENTKLVGPLYIGDNTIIGNNNIIRDSFIGEHCVTGFNTDITRSYIGDHCWFHSNYIGDSVLEGNVSMGSGSVLANLRLDEGEIHSTVREIKLNTHKTKLGAMIARDVRIGVNASIMPGVKIGTNSFVGAGIVLDADLPEESFCVGARSGYTISKNTKKIGSDRTIYKAKL